MNDLTIAIEDPLQDDVRALIVELNATLLALRPPEFVFHMTAEQMAEPDTTVFIAREDGEAVACGALKRHADGVDEVKRMYTRPSHRGRRIGAMIVGQVEALARREGLRRLVLETGGRYPAAWTVYERAGSRAAGRCRCSTTPIRSGRCSMKRRSDWTDDWVRAVRMLKCRHVGIRPAITREARRIVPPLEDQPAEPVRFSGER